MAKRGRPPKQRTQEATQVSDIEKKFFEDVADTEEKLAEGYSLQHAEYRNQRRYGDALAIATAILGSPRHTTLNEGFAKQCVEFVKALERESGHGSD